MPGKHKRTDSAAVRRHARPHLEAPRSAPPPKPGAGEDEPEEGWLQDSQISIALPMERLLRVVRWAAREKNFTGPEQVDAFLAGFTDEDFQRSLAALRASSPREEAQQLAYDAILSAGSDAQALQLAQRALELDPDCADARMVAAEIRHSSHMDAFIAEVEQAVDAAARSLGPGFLDEHKGEIWERLEARPYMRARFRLADSCRLSGRTGDAIRHFEALLDLNPHDDQRVRDQLLACYLTTSRLDAARNLLLRFRLDDSAVFHWGRVLERFLSGDPTAAYRDMKKACEQNKHVEAYLTFTAKPPRELPESYVPGDPEEAAHCLYVMGSAWAAHPQAVLWVREIREQGWK